MTWARRALYVLPLLVAGGGVLVILMLDVLGAWCSDLDSGNYHCNTAGDAAWITLYLGFLLTAISLVIWAVTMLRLMIRRRHAGLHIDTSGS